MIRSCRYVGRTPDTLDNGRPVATGDTVDADVDDPYNALLIEEGALIVVGEPDQPAPKLTGQALETRGKELQIEGFSSMNADDKRAAIAKAETTTNETQED